MDLVVGDGDRLADALGRPARSRARGAPAASHSATSAALPPAAWPPTPSMTMNTPRAGSTWKRSSLTSRWRPGIGGAGRRDRVERRIAIGCLPGSISHVDRDRYQRGQRTSGERQQHHESRQSRSVTSASQPGVELEEDGVREADARLIRQRRLDAVLALGAVDFVVAARHVAPVQRRAERAQIDQEEDDRSVDRGECARARATRRPTTRS